MFSNKFLTVSIKHFLAHTLWKMKAYVNLSLVNFIAADTMNLGHCWKASMAP